MKISAQKIVNLLAVKHSADMFVPECKDGPSYGRDPVTGKSHLRMDAWVMNRSWANACITAYEVKVSRSDFLADNKWTDYLPLCNCFYFVCPTELIALEEVPAGTGLIYVSKTGTRLFTKRKAPRREVEIPESLWRYVLMCRTRIDTERSFRATSQEQYWKTWLKTKREKRKIGYEVSRQLRQHLDRQRERRERAEALVAGYEQFRAKLRELGIDPDKPIHSWSAERQIGEVLGRITPRFRHRLKGPREDLERLEREIERMADSPTEDAA